MTHRPHCPPRRPQEQRLPRQRMSRAMSMFCPMSCRPSGSPVRCSFRWKSRRHGLTRFRTRQTSRRLLCLVHNTSSRTTSCCTARAGPRWEKSNRYVWRPATCSSCRTAIPTGWRAHQTCARWHRVKRCWVSSGTWSRMQRHSRSLKAAEGPSEPTWFAGFSGATFDRSTRCSKRFRACCTCDDDLE